MKTLSIDIETYSGYDLSKCGVYKYAESPDFEILLFGYSVDDGEVQVIDLATGEHLPPEILNMTLVRNAIKADTRSRTELTRLMKELTDLDNPNSVQQMKGWLADNGMETDSLGKKVVVELLKDAPEPLGKVLALRQQLAKSSVKKYQTMENAVCADSRARGMFQFYGANRTGRWAGRLIQMQNLPQNHLTDLEEARGLVHDGDFATLELLGWNEAFYACLLV